MKVATAVSLAALGVLGACASSPAVRFYTLSEVGGVGSAAAVPAAASDVAPIRVARVGLPTELDRSQIVRRMDANRLEIQDLDRWAAPLDEMILRVLWSDLAARLPPNTMANAAAPATHQATRLLSVELQEFSGDSNCAVTLRGAWTLKLARQPAAGSDLQGLINTQVPSSGACTVGALPAAMSQAIGQMSDGIAAAITR
ncbi:MAG: PqiC family protein [Gammaproteobacteria bacterium]